MDSEMQNKKGKKSETVDKSGKEKGKGGAEKQGKKKEASVKKSGKKFKGHAGRVKFPKWMFQKKPRLHWSEGGVIPATAALGRLIRWPKYVRIQRQRKVLLQRLKIPPALNIFRNPCTKDLSGRMVTFLKDYKPESRKSKKKRLRSWAKLQENGQAPPSEKPCVVQYGFNHVTHLIEGGRARLVLIAHDVDPIELVLWMPSLCMMKNVPFVIIASKSRLGTLVHKKTATCVCVTDVKKEDEDNFREIQKEARRQFNDRYEELKKNWGSRSLGIKTLHKIAKKRKIRALERAKRREAMSQQNSSKK